MSEEPNYWKKCSSCKKQIGFSTKYYLCSVSTCKHSRKGFTFCSPTCWSEHLGFMNHREAWAEDYHSPSKAEVIQNSTPASSASSSSPKGRKIIVGKRAESSLSTPRDTIDTGGIQTDTLVVVSKVKKLIKEQSGMNVSQCCVDGLTKKVIGECLKAIEKAKVAGRKTVMGRDL